MRGACRAQSVTLNMCTLQDVDLPVMLHFALFNSTTGYVLKPPEMIGEQGGQGLSDDDFWPPPRDALHCVTIELLSIHNFPKVRPFHTQPVRVASRNRQKLILLFCCPQGGERRPRLDGRHQACHRYHPELSGTVAPPEKWGRHGSYSIGLSIHAIGG